MELQSYLWNPTEESLDPVKRQGLQWERLTKTVRRLYEKAPWYQRKMDLASLKPGHIESLKDLTKLPFTTKEELRDCYPFGLILSPLDQVLRLHTSSGTTGKPTVVAYTKADLELWAECTARALAASGVKPGIMVQNAYGYGLTTGGLGFQLGAEKIGACLVPASGGMANKQLELLKDFKSSALLSTASFAATLLEEAQKEGINPNDLPVKVALFGGENCSPALKKRLEENLNLRADDTYGLSEILGPGVAHQCPTDGGLHINEDHFLAEIVDFETGEVLPEGQAGELVLSSITREATPLLRYRTRDKTHWISEPCQCSRTFRRIAPVLGRADQEIKVGDLGIHPVEIEDLLLSVPEISAHYQLEVADNHFLKIRVERNHSIYYHNISETQLVERATEVLNKKLDKASYKIELVSAGTIPRSQGKAQRVVELTTTTI